MIMRQKIDFGIDLGTTNSAIAVMQDGEAVIIKSDDNQMDTTSSCVSFNKKQTIFVGLSAKQGIDREAVNNFKRRKYAEPNGYQEFKRNMGTDHQYRSSNMSRSYSSEELSAELLKKLKGYVREEAIVAAVITVPAMFEQRQLDATQRAAELAGFGYCELLQEPIAASIAYGVKASSQSGYWLVFDFGGGTFDAALMHVEEGIMKVVDTEGDNHLGGKDLDDAIVDQLLIPELQRQCSLDETLSNDKFRKLLQEALKKPAEDAKVSLSSKSQWSYFIEDLGEDDEGDEIEVDISVTLEQYEQVVTPIFQRAIDITKKLLARNNIAGNDLTSLILVGGPTFQQTLRRMLTEQITPKIDTSIDPMTAVGRGAALFASTKNIPQNLQKRDTSKAQLTLRYPETTVETLENLGLRIDRELSTANLPESFILEIVRNDSAWSSGKLTIDNDVEIIELQLNEGKSNQFNIKLFSPDGALIPCEPSSINIIQGVKIAAATLPLAIGLEIFDTLTTKQGVYALDGLEKNKTLPAKGKGVFKTMKDVRPSVKEDVLTIPIYEFKQESSRALHNSRFGQFIITGADLPSFLPAGSDIEVTLNIDASRRGKLSVYIPALDESFDFDIVSTIDTDISTDQLKRELSQARQVAIELASEGNYEAEMKINDINEAEKLLEARSEDRSTKDKVRSDLKNTFVELDKYEAEGAWPKAQGKLKVALKSLRDTNENNGNAKTRSMMFEFESQAQQIYSKQDVNSAIKLEDQVRDVTFEVYRQDRNFWISYIIYMDESFDEITWTDEQAAYRGLQQLKQLLNSEPSKEVLEDAVIAVAQYMTPESQAKMQNVDTSLLRR
ncbi:Hsp70 family protein [Psychrobacter sp. Ps1]|uniref:Hsp70 family protein n=1 Tax=Psychrobacter sp. Ps1 TaxID=2790955 RepID=UPI001EDDFE8F|nr:Hsp70 family protein [Psychrobacter sp. Ps1]